MKNFLHVSAKVLGALLIISSVFPALTASAAGAPFVTTNSAYSQNVNTASLYGSVNANDLPTTVWFEYGTTQSLGLQTPSQSISGFYPIDVTAQASNLQQNTTYFYRAVAVNSIGRVNGEIRTFVTNGFNTGNCGINSVVTNPVTSTNSSVATLSGSVTGASQNTTVFFQYGTSPSGLQSSPAQYVASAPYTTQVNFTAYNLQQNTTYFYRLVAQTNCGAQIEGQLLTFSTGGTTNNNGSYLPPTVITNSVTTRDNTSANLSGTANPNGSETSAWYEYSTSQSSFRPLNSRSIGSGFVAVPRSTLVVGLRSGTTYYYRLVAQNAYGVSRGQVLSFTTTGTAPTPVPQPVTPRPTSTVATSTPTTQPTSTVATTTPTTGAPIIVATPEFSDESVKSGKEIKYTLTLKNNGSADATNVSVTLSLPSELEYSKSEPTLSSNNSGNYIFALGTMNPGDQKKLEVTLKAKSDISTSTIVQVNAVIDYTDSTNKRQATNGSRTLQIDKKGKSGLASIGGIFGRIGNIPGYIWFFIFLLAMIVAVTWVFFAKLRGTEPEHHDEHGDDHDAGHAPSGHDDHGAHH